MTNPPAEICCGTCAFWDEGDDDTMGLCRWRPVELDKRDGQRCGQHKPNSVNPPAEPAGHGNGSLSRFITTSAYILEALEPNGSWFRLGEIHWSRCDANRTARRLLEDRLADVVRVFPVTVGIRYIEEFPVSEVSGE